MIVLDASVLIAYFETADPHHAEAEATLDAHAAEAFAASQITLAEFYVGPATRGQLPAAAGRLQALGVQALPFPNDLPQRLAELRASTKLKLPDCCVLLAALDARAKLAAFDKTLRDAARDHGVSVLGTLS